MKASFSRTLFGMLVALAPLAAQGQPNLRAVVRAASEYESGASVLPLRQIEQWVAAATSDGGLRRRLEDELAGSLPRAATYEGRRFICQQLAIIGSEDCVGALASLLPHPETADIACQALANNPSAKASVALREAARALQTPATRIAVVKTLGTRRDAAAVPLLSELANHSDAGLAEAATISLGKIANEPALKTLAALRRGEDRTRVHWAAEATLIAAERVAASALPKGLDDLYEELLQPTYPPSVRRGAFDGLVRLDTDRGQQRILEVLKTQDPALKPVAIARIPALPNPVASARFAAELPKLEPADQALLVAALGERGDPAARPAVQNLLASTDPDVRRATIAALGQLGDASTVFPLSRALMTAQSSDETKAIVLALTQLEGGDPVDRALMARLRDRMVGPKQPLLEALVRRNHRVALPLLYAEASGADATLAKLAFQGLSRQATPEDIPQLLGALAAMRAEARPEAEAAVARALDRVPQSAERSEAVRAALAQATAPEARASLLRLLPVCGDLDALGALEAAIADPVTHDVALRALADWPNDMAWDSLMLRYGKTASEAQRVVVLRGLTRLAGERNARPTPALIDRYRRLFAPAQGDADRKLILGALSGCAHPDALTLAVDQLSQAGVRAEAAQAVKSIAEAIKAQHPQAAAAALHKVQ